MKNCYLILTNTACVKWYILVLATYANNSLRKHLVYYNCKNYNIFYLSKRSLVLVFSFFIFDLEFSVIYSRNKTIC